MSIYNVNPDYEAWKDEQPDTDERADYEYEQWKAEQMEGVEND